MSKKYSPRKKYGMGTSSKGIDPSHFIVTPEEALNDYNIMLAKAENKANSNPWLPVMATLGVAAQQFTSLAGKGNKSSKVTPEETSLGEGDIAAMGNNNIQKDVEVEGGEMFETPQGEVGEFQGPSHEEGGIPLEVGEDVEQGTKVYSDRLKVGNKTLAERKATRERQIANLEKIASNNLADQAVKNAAKRKMQAIEKEEAADLDFQEKVSNMQTMADTMVKAFGIGMSGIQKYEGGTGEEGIEDPNDPIVNLNKFLITPGVVGTSKPIIKKYSTVSTKPEAPEYMKNLEPTPVLNFANNFGEPVSSSKTDFGAQDFVDSFNPALVDAKEDAEFYSPNQVGNPIENNPETIFSRTANKIGKNIKDIGDKIEIPTAGDITKLLGNYLGMTSGIKNATEQRSTDVTHTNVYENVGKDSQRLLDNAKQGIEASKAQAIIKATANSRGGKKGARGTARGVNTMRATDWLYDTALQEQINEISANAAQQISSIDTQKSSVAMNADQLKGQGKYQAAMANEAAKDAYYTALGLGKKDFATGLQQTGKDLNDIKQNKIIENLMKNYGKWVSTDKKGNLVNKENTTTEQIVTDEAGNKYKVDKNGKLIKVVK